MGLLRDFRVIFHMLFKRGKGRTHSERMENFYSAQAKDYDEFRKKLLTGREELWHKLPVPPQGVWVDFGGGTGWNLENLSERIHELKKIYVIDLSTSLLNIARQRFAARGWTNAEAVEADATTYTPPEGFADVVTFSYSLTMIPNWFAAIENAKRILKPGGTIGIVDFYVSRKHAAEGLVQHRWFTRNFWPTWFATDNVFPDKDHLPFLLHHFAKQDLLEGRCKIPYLPIIRMPYYRLIATKPIVEQV
ncbi:MAG TPA: class I SAM-dependent methyltransferase [Pirellulaceae bacterium]|nr:class I SAM-dependent methyltransferase [Pirellulaceae bacterium]HMO93746.1 class I SAM-dependent methyltransferase [Pirellulaceae bacterium]HMP69917.1 class I SAM-dependent methyltransferase [Pirellulaceae bacterium]